MSSVEDLPFSYGPSRAHELAAGIYDFRLAWGKLGNWTEAAKGFSWLA